MKSSRGELLELWSDLTATRYEELFLVPVTPATIDELVFDQPLGRYLEYLDDGTYRPYRWDPNRPESVADGNVGLVNHVGTVQAALQLSADDVERILADAGTTLEAAPLDLATVSLLHRYGVLARSLRMPVADLITLRQLSGLDPFAPPSPQPVESLAEDHAQTTVRFVEAVLAIRDADLSVADADYLLRHRYDPAGPELNAAAPPLALVRTLDAEIARIRTEHADPVDAITLTDEELRQKMALVLAADAVEWFFGMSTGTITHAVEEIDVDEADQLDPAAVAGEPAVTLTYDPEAEKQHLVYRGVLFEEEKRRLVAEYTGPREAKRLYGELLGSVQQTARDFFDLNLLAPVGFLDAADYESCSRRRRPTQTRPPSRTISAGSASGWSKSSCRTCGTSSSIRRCCPPSAPSSRTRRSSSPPWSPSPRCSPTALWPDDALLSAYRAAGDRGLTVTADIDAGTATIDTYFEVPTAGSYCFFVACGRAGTVVDLRFDHVTDALLLDTTTADGEELGTFPGPGPRHRVPPPARRRGNRRRRGHPARPGGEPPQGQRGPAHQPPRRRGGAGAAGARAAGQGGATGGRGRADRTGAAPHADAPRRLRRPDARGAAGDRSRGHPRARQRAVRAGPPAARPRRAPP